MSRIQPEWSEKGNAFAETRFYGGIRLLKPFLSQKRAQMQTCTLHLDPCHYFCEYTANLSWTPLGIEPSVLGALLHSRPHHQQPSMDYSPVTTRPVLFSSLPSSFFLPEHDFVGRLLVPVPVPVS